VLVTVALAVAWTGAGRFSVDHLLGWPLSGVRSTLLALGVAIAGWLVGAATRRWSSQARTGTAAGRAA
jgi:hypothetical protein